MRARPLPSVLILALAAFPSAAPGQDGESAAFEMQMRQAREAARRAEESHDATALRQAFDAFRAASELRPKDPTPLAEAGLLASDLGLRGDAAQLLQKIEEVAPDSGQFYLLRGTIRHRLSDYRDAAEDFRAAGKREYRAADARLRLFQSLLALGLDLIGSQGFEEAVKVLSGLVQEFPDNREVRLAYYNLAVAHRRHQQAKPAEEVLKECIRRFPTYPNAYGELGALLADQDRHGEALKWLDDSVKVDPGYAQGWLLRGMTLTAKGLLDEADAAFREFERRFPTTGPFEYERGVYFVRRRQWEKAIERLRHALALDPTQVRAHLQMAVCWRGLGKDDLAREAEARWKSNFERFQRDTDRRAEEIRRRIGHGGPAPAPTEEKKGPEENKGPEGNKGAGKEPPKPNDPPPDPPPKPEEPPPKPEERE